MRIAIVHLSDIHLRISGNFVSERASHIVSAAASEDPSVHVYIVAISGDVAFSGITEEYDLARQFFEQIRTGLANSATAKASVHFIGIPGNHDCVLPESGTTLRNALISGILPTIHGPAPDQATLSQLLSVQSGYENFHRHMFDHPEWDGVCAQKRINLGDKSVQINLYNTAILSRLAEGQGQLHVPTKVIDGRIAPTQDASLTLSMFHHSYLWLESNTATTFRNHIERTSDVAVMGHQHLQHSFYKQNSTGERVLYVEGGALQDKDYPRRSEFQLLLFDLENPSFKLVHFRWADDLYRRTQEPTWITFSPNRGIRAEYRIAEDFESELNDIGTPIRHRLKGNLSLRDIFVYPDFVVRTQAPKPDLKEVLGVNLLNYIAKSERVVFQFPAFGGKTSLSRVLFADMLASLDIVPLLIDGRIIQSSSENRVVGLFWKTFQRQYEARTLDEFQQLPRPKRALIVDDWHYAALNASGRRAFLELASQYFGKIILFADESFQIQELVSGSPDTLLAFDFATAMELGHASRGKIIDRWVTLGREHIAQETDLAREIEQTENLVRSVMGKNTLPSMPFVVVCILQADQEDKAEAPEAGSFGYLYDVLVTTLLNTSSGRKTQLEKKYIFLANLAYEMLAKNTDVMSAIRARQIAEEYSRSHLVKVDIEPLLADLEDARVLIKSGADYRFGYTHLFFYFIAKFYKDNLHGPASTRLLDEIDAMADRISSDKYSTILMFFLYMTRDSTGLIDRLIKNADRIYANETPATLQEDVAFLNEIGTEEEFEIPENIDVAQRRKEQREARDRIERSADAMSSRETREFSYSDDLPDTQKFDLAYKHLELLGQVLRNFPGSLPGPDKLAILRSTYLLGLRLLGSLFKVFRMSFRDYVDIMRKASDESKGKIPNDLQTIRRLVDQLIILLNRMVTLGILTKISSNVGLQDLENAYSGVLKLLEDTNAVRLVDVAIKLDHAPGFPESEVADLHAHLSRNASRIQSYEILFSFT
jgi:hypothetical protein